MLLPRGRMRRREFVLFGQCPALPDFRCSDDDTRVSSAVLSTTIVDIKCLRFRLIFGAMPMLAMAERGEAAWRMPEGAQERLQEHIFA